jgi:membrane protease YdiL (CAAX protease family)
VTSTASPGPEAPASAPSDARSRREWIVAALELALASLLVVGANLYDWVPISETPWLVILGTLSLRRRRLGWRALGLTRPPSWPKTIAAAVLAGIALQVASEYAIEPFAERLTGRAADLSSFRPLVGNLPLTLGWLALVWTLAAFGEEMGYRGHVLDRAAALGGGTRRAYVVAMLLVSVLFGLGHWYQGASGVIGSTFSGLLFGALYLASGRNLWLPILAHGFSDTIALAIVYLGLAPEVGP